MPSRKASLRSRCSKPRRDHRFTPPRFRPQPGAAARRTPKAGRRRRPAGHALSHGRLVVQPPLGKQVDHATAGAGLRIAGAVDDAGETRMEHRPRAHRTRLQRHEQLAAGQPVIAQPPRRIAQRLDFGVRARVVLDDGRIEAASDDHAITDDDGPDRNLAAAADSARINASRIQPSSASTSVAAASPAAPAFTHSPRAGARAAHGRTRGRRHGSATSRDSVRCATSPGFYAQPRRCRVSKWRHRPRPRTHSAAMQSTTPSLVHPSALICATVAGSVA